MAEPARVSGAVPAALASAPRAALRDEFSPQLATLAKAPPTVGDWGYELKFDGYRILARIEKGACRLFTRNGNDWTDKMESLAKKVASLGIESGWLDGEAVVMGANGQPSLVLGKRVVLRSPVDCSYETRRLGVVTRSAQAKESF